MAGRYGNSNSYLLLMIGKGHKTISFFILSEYFCTSGNNDVADVGFSSGNVLLHSCGQSRPSPRNTHNLVMNSC